jgi:hypothetical protein
LQEVESLSDKSSSAQMPIFLLETSFPIALDEVTNMKGEPG